MGSVSVVIPAYNPRLDWLDEAIRSAVGQDPAPLEVIVVDDGSGVPVAYGHSLVRVVRQDNGGVAAARNTGVREARGRFVAFLDQDDAWAPGKLAAQVTLMGPGVGLCSTGFEIVDDEGRSVGPGWGGPAGGYRDLRRGNSVAASTVMVDRATLVAVGGFSRDLPRVDDWDAWLRVVRVSRAVHVDAPLVRYRMHGSNESRDYRAMYAGSLRVLWRHRSAAILSGARRMGQIYGAQAFDAFREHHRPSDLAWAVALWPDFVARQAWARASKALESSIRGTSV